jgi:hypothetical protein
MAAAAIKQTKSTDKFSKIWQWKSEQWKNNSKNDVNASSAENNDNNAEVIGKATTMSGDADNNDDNLHLPIQRLRTGVVEGGAESSAKSGDAACPT